MYTKGYRCVVNAISSKDGQDCARKSRADKGSTAVVIKCRWQHILTNYEIQCFLRLDYLNLITVIQAAFLRTCKGRSQWSSGSAPECSARGPGIESRCGQLCLSHNHWDLQPWARAVCTLPAVPRSTQPSTLRGTVNEYHLSDWVIVINGDGGCRC